MTNKEKYRKFCEKEKNIPIFSKDWWLDSVCGENAWDVVLFEKGGEIWASLPYQKTKKGSALLAILSIIRNTSPIIKIKIMLPTIGISSIISRIIFFYFKFLTLTFFPFLNNFPLCEQIPLPLFEV